MKLLKFSFLLVCALALKKERPTKEELEEMKANGTGGINPYGLATEEQKGGLSEEEFLDKLLQEKAQAAHEAAQQEKAKSNQDREDAKNEAREEARENHGVYQANLKREI